jgi:soluble lytic murein transglycosylase-like protein
VSETYRAEIEIAAATHGLDSNLVQAVVEQESSYRWFAYRFEPAFYTRYLAHLPEYMDRDPREVSASYGLMQVMYTTALEHGFRGKPWEMFVPSIALDNGCRVLSGLLAWSGGITEQALGAYNAGPGGWKSGPGRLYTASVMTRYQRIKQEHA